MFEAESLGRGCENVKTWGSAGVIESYRGFSDLRVRSLQKRMHHVHLVDLRFDANFGAKPLLALGLLHSSPDHHRCAMTGK
jgi:hypothetical protein